MPIRPRVNRYLAHGAWRAGGGEESMGVELDVRARLSVRRCLLMELVVCGLGQTHRTEDTAHRLTQASESRVGPCVRQCVHGNCQRRWKLEPNGRRHDLVAWPRSRSSSRRTTLDVDRERDGESRLSVAPCVTQQTGTQATRTDYTTGTVLGRLVPGNEQSL